MARPSRECPLCPGSEPAPRIDATDYITGKTMPVLQCPRCQLAQTIGPADLSEFYPESYRRYHPIVLAVLQRAYRRHVRAWSKALRRRGAVLEIGYGPGWMLHEFHKAGWSAFGVEQAADHVKPQESGIQTFQRLEDLPAGQTFDLVLMFQSLEHLPAPVAVLRQCHDRLRADGLLIVSVPNFASWQARWSDAAWFHLDVPRHLFHFSPRSLERCLAASGFRVVETRSIGLGHDAYGWVQSAMNKAGLPQNALTRLLMHLPGRRSGLSITGVLALAAILSLPALAMTLLSWLAGAGALIEVRAVRERADAPNI